MTFFAKRLAPLLLALALCAGALAGCAPTQRQPGAQEEAPQQAPKAPGVVFGAVVGAGGQGAADYPPAEKMDAAALAEAADGILDLAQENSVNALFYEATPLGQAAYLSKVLQKTGRFQFSTGFFSKVDPLKILLERAAQRGVAVYAVMSPYEAGPADEKPARGTLAARAPQETVSLGAVRYYRPDSAKAHTQAVEAAYELARGYSGLAGVVVGHADGGQVSDYPGFYTYLNALVSDIAGAVRSASGGAMAVGLSLSAAAPASDNRSAFIESACRASVDFIVPAAAGSAGEGAASPYAAALQALSAPARQNGKAVYPALPGEGGDDAAAYADKMFVHNALGLPGGVLASLAPLRDTQAGIMEAVIPLAFIEGSIVPDYQFEIPSAFRLTRPLDGKSITIPQEYDTYYITGTSDPGQPVLYEGEEIERISQNGLFGVLVEVEPGENAYTFQQGDQVLTANLYRPDGSEGPARLSAISTYISGSTPVFQPYGPQAVGEGLPMLFQCTAPSGGKVTATLDGQEYALEQTAAAEDGVAATFRKEVRIPPKDADAVVSLGTVTYTLEFEGETSQAEAPGEVFSVGGNCTPMLRVETDLGTVLDESMVNGNFVTHLKRGSVAEITGQTANYFKTSFGGFINKIETSIVTDLESTVNRVSAVDFLPADDKGDERLVLAGTVNPSFVVDSGAGEDFVIRLFDTTGVPDGAIEAQSAFFSAISAKTEGDTLTLTCRPGGESYFGYNVSYNGDETVLTFYKKPALSGVKGRPLLGSTIVLDPGHGGKDAGSLGVPGSTGPMEKNVNLYVAQMTQRLLEGLGAEVYITRQSDEDFLELTERVGFAEQYEPDFFISMHHNSLNENLNPERVEGTWVFYYNDFSEGLAEKMLGDISAASGRKPMGTDKAYYVVCRGTFAPALLLELGFMPNPKEYEQICSEQNMLRIARTVCGSLVDYVEGLS